MKFKIQESENEMNITISGRLDSNTTPKLDKELTNRLDNITSLNIDLKNLEYVSSAGLRLLLFMQKTINKQGTMTVTNVNDTVTEIFDITGFSDILTIQ